MFFGQTFGAGLGNPQNLLLYVKTKQVTPTKYMAYFKPVPGQGNQYFQVYNNAILQRTVFAYEGVEQKIPIIPNPGATEISVVVLCVGYSSLPGYSEVQVAREFEKDDSEQVTADWKWTGEIFDTDDPLSQLVNFNITGLERTNTTIIAANKQHSYVTANLTVTAGIATVDILDASHTVVSSGSNSVGNTVSITPIDGGIIQGTCYVQPSAATTNGITLFIRWDASMNILKDVVNPPAVVYDNVPFDGQTTGTWSDRSNIAGTFYYALQPVSDTGEVSLSSNVTQEIIITKPNAPTNIHRVSGNAANMVIGFTPSNTPSAASKAYLSQDQITQTWEVEHPINVFQAAGSAATGVGTINLPPITGYPGTAYLYIRANLGAGAEEHNGNVFAMTFDGAGNFVSPMPNTPSIVLESVKITTGRALTLRGVYVFANEPDVATALQMFVRTKAGSYNFAAPVATTSLAGLTPILKTATMNYTFPSDGTFFVVLKAVTANSVLGGQSNEVMVQPNITMMPAPDDAEFVLSRG